MIVKDILVGELAHDSGQIIAQRTAGIFPFHVASMSRGAAGKLWEALKTNGNFATRRDMESVRMRRNSRATSLFYWDYFWLGREGSNLRMAESKSAAGRLNHSKLLTVPRAY